MTIRVPKDIASDHRKALCNHGFDNPDKYRFHDYLLVQLDDHSQEEVKWLRALLEANSSVKGCKGAVRDIDAWLSLKGGGDLPKARDCQRAEGLLKAYIGALPRKHIYSHTKDGGMLAYYVQKIEYSPPHGDVPAHVEITLRYNQFGEIQTRSITLYTDDVRSMTPQEILAAKGFVLETVMFRDNYEEDLKRYEDVLSVIGRQYLATGTATVRDRHGWYAGNVNMEDDQGNAARVVVDVFKEGDESSYSKDKPVSGTFWSGKEREDVSDEELEATRFIPEVPVHPYVVVFHLKKHRRVTIHVQNLELYQYDEEMRHNLILPDRDQALLDVLLADTRTKFEDVVGGKAGGVVVLCQGPPGTGKTLTAEIYAESLQRPLYTVQCSQLGIDAEELEKELLLVFSRAQRWGAIMLLDEADVYIHERGNDLVQNAIVGVFLRVLEYYDGVLFMTTNRGDTVDDAVLSRCTVRIPYTVPPAVHQRRIWEVLAIANNLELKHIVLDEIVDRFHDLSGRDIKNLLKLCTKVHRHTGAPIDWKMVEAMRQYKPTNPAE